MLPDDGPSYRAMYEHLQQELSPRRRQGGSPSRREGIEAAVKAVDDALATDPAAFRRPAAALEALLATRDGLAEKFRQIHEQARRRRDGKAAGKQRGPSPMPPALRKDLAFLADFMGTAVDRDADDPNASDADLESLPKLPAEDRRQPVLGRSDVTPEVALRMETPDCRSPAEKAKQCAEHVLKARPWLAARDMNEAQASAAANLLLYAEGLQGYRTLHQTRLKPGREVAATRPLRCPSDPSRIVVQKGALGVVRDVVHDPKSRKVKVSVAFNSRADGRTGPLAVGEDDVAVHNRRIVPVESLDKYGAAAEEHPTVAAHTPASKLYPSRASFETDDLSPVARALGVPFEGSSGRFTMHDLSFHTREPWLSDGISADRYQGAASMVGQNVCVVDDPQYITAASQTCFDKNVESSLAPLYCGRVGRVIEVNVAACTARVAFGDGHSSWLPLLALTLCNPDPFLSMGSRNTSMSVFGRPDTAAAAKEIAAYENARREERRAARYR